MPTCDFLIIGGGIAAFSAAKKIQRSQPDASVTMVTRDILPPYDLPPLSKEFLTGAKSEAQLIYPAAAISNATLLTRADVVALDVDKRVARVNNGSDWQFDKALIASGADPIKLTCPGAHLSNIFYLRTAADASAIAALAGAGRRACVIGAGFIGLEIAASLTTLGCDVTVVEAMDRIWPRFGDAGIAAVVQADCEARGIRFATSEMVVELLGEEHVRAAVTASGEAIPCDFVVVGIGIRPNVELARKAGVEVDNGIVVDAGMRTSAANIFAAGDVVNYHDPISGLRRRGEHWGHAEYSGQLAGGNMSGADGAYDFMNYAWSDVFGMHFDSAGHVEDFDEIVVRGSIEDRKFTSLYLRKGSLKAYCAINCEPVDFASYRRLIRSGQDLTDSIAQLQDPEVRARSLISA